MPKLEFREGPHGEAEFIFEATVVIGRGPLADLSLNDPTVSRGHAMLSWADEKCFVSDLHSQNGTFINDDPVEEPTRMRHGDRLRVGSTIAEFIDDQPRNTDRSESSVRLVEGAKRDATLVSSMGSNQATKVGATASSGEDGGAVSARRLRFLGDLGRRISETLDENELLSFVAEQVFDLLPQAERSCVLEWDSWSQQLKPRVGRTRSGQSVEIVAERKLLEDVIERREAMLARNAPDAPKPDASSLCVPIVFRDGLLGAIYVVGTGYNGRLSRGDMALLLGVATQVGMALTNLRLHGRFLERELLERDMSLARKIQHQFLPQHPPQIPGYAFCVEYSPAFAVGGDFFDFLDLPGDTLGVAVGDVAGKGVAAALYVAKLSRDVRYLAAGHTDPGEIIGRLNRVTAVDTREGMFATLSLMVLNPKTGELTVSGAGHPPSFLRRGSEIIPLGQRTGPALSVMDDATYDREEYQLEPGDVVVSYTDGITEAMGPDEELFGTERLQDVILASAGRVEGTSNAVLSAVKRFVGGQAQSDDITMVCFGRQDAG